MKSSEKMIIGIFLGVAGGALFFCFGLPQWDTYNANTTKTSSLTEEFKSAETEKQVLNASIARLKHNIALPLDIDVQSFTTKTESNATKELLARVANLATQSNNKFISLSPTDVPALFTPSAEGDKSNTENGGASTDNKDAKATTDEKNTDSKSDDSSPLITKGYEFSIRGTYDSLQAFLRNLAAEKMVFDLYNFELINEMTENLGNTDSLAEPSYPLRLKVTLRLAMQRVEELTTPEK